MKKVFLVCFAIFSGLLGLLALINLLYNPVGLFHVQDAAEGSTWELISVVLLCLTLAVGAFYLCYWLIRRAHIARVALPPTNHDSM